MREDLLEGIMKPGRYIGREWNIAQKDFEQAEVKFALCFPDLYEVGMSNLGLRILYAILNDLAWMGCERFFSCGLDLEKALRFKDAEIFSLETCRPLKQFDLIGFSLGSELLYSNVLNVLDLGKIPLRSEERGCDYPLVMGGGPCALNPEPLHDFFDLFIIGEAEEAIVEITAVYRKVKNDFKSGRLSKQDLLLEFSKVEGAYVPSFYEVGYDLSGKIQGFIPRLGQAPAKIKKRIVQDLDHANYPSQWLLPFIQVVHDRITLEVMRGCPNQCRFCQARAQYFPLRIKTAQNLFSQAQQAYQSSGYEEIALGGLSVSDYPYLSEILQKMITYFSSRCVSVSLPSLKPRNLLGDASNLIATFKKTGLTFAPEAGTEKLRNILAKDFNLEEFLKVLRQAYSSGYQHVKLYFMIGLPGETENDLDAIADLAQQVLDLGRQVNPALVRKGWVNLSINTIIPKPHTPFQWHKMQGLEAVSKKQEYLRRKIHRNKKIKINFHNRYMGFLEGVFSRGDRRLSSVIMSAFRKGAKFDAWEDHFKFDLWQEAFKENGIQPEFYLEQKEEKELLPWDFIDTGISKEFLLSEFKKTIVYE